MTSTFDGYIIITLTNFSTVRSDGDISVGGRGRIDSQMCGGIGPVVCDGRSSGAPGGSNPSDAQRGNDQSTYVYLR